MRFRLHSQPARECARYEETAKFIPYCTSKRSLNTAAAPSPSQCAYLCIDVTKRSRQRVARILDRCDWNTNIAQINRIAQYRIPTRRIVVHRNRSSQCVLPVCNIQILPCPPRAINHGVMQEEVRISWASEQVTPRIASNSEMPRGVDAEKPSGEIALHVVAKGKEVGVVLDERHNI
jgi:hypothetical protein